MHIEFHTPAGETQEWLVDHIKQKLIEMHHQFNQIARAEVYLKNNPTALDGEYTCEIDLTIFGSSITVESSAESYVRSASEVINELEKRVQEQAQKQRDLPDDLLSTVKV